MKSRPILVDNTSQELTEHGSESFAMSMDEQHVNMKDHGSVPHWHYEVQISLVTKGSVLFRVNDEDFLLKAGEGIFINSGALHEAVPADCGEGVYICVNFHPKVIYGYSNSLLRYAYVDPVLSCGKIQAIALRNKPWHREICRLMDDLAKTDATGNFGYEVMMYAIVLRIWHLVVKNNEENLNQQTKFTFAERQRIKALTGFIHKNYMEDITLSEIAKSDHISRGECCRIFKRVLGTTPFKYLISYRLHQSLKLISMSDMNISDIAQAVGFGSGSYFTECFKREVKCTPMAYRKRLAKA